MQTFPVNESRHRQLMHLRPLQYRIQIVRPDLYNRLETCREWNVHQQHNVHSDRHVSHHQRHVHQHALTVACQHPFESC
jgi:hypothetical protein